MDGHTGEIQRLLGRGEIRCIDGPGFLGVQAESANDVTMTPRDQSPREPGLAPIHHDATLSTAMKTRSQRPKRLVRSSATAV